jgi:hypothetical protein
MRERGSEGLDLDSSGGEEKVWREEELLRKKNSSGRGREFG